MAENTQEPLIDRASLEAQFGKNEPISKPDPLPNKAFTGLNLSTGGGSQRQLSPLEALEASVKANADGKLRGGSVMRPMSEMSNARFDSFVPGDYNNEDAYAQGQGWTEKMVNGVGKGLVLTGTTFLQSTVGLANGVGNWIATGKFSSFYDNDLNNKLDEISQTLDNELLPNYYTDVEKNARWYSPDKLFTANFLWNGIVKNLGFAAGAALSGNVFASGIKALSSLPGISRLVSIGKQAEVLAATEASLLSANKVADTYGKIKGLSDQFLNSYKLLSPGGRAVVAGLATTGEAGFEALQTLNEKRNELIQEYTNANNGVPPTGAELEEINNKAAEVGNAAFFANVGLLTATNYIQFPKILGSSYRAEKGIINSLASKTDEIVEEAGKYITKPSRGGRFINTVNKIRPYTFSASEAFEEGAQFAIGKSVNDYYNKKNNNEPTSFLKSLYAGVSETLGTDEGMENILIGGLSGALMQGRGKYLEAQETAKNTADAIQKFNNFRLSDFTKDTIDSVNRGTVIQEEREKFLKSGDVLNSKDLEADYVINYLAPRIKYGRFDLVQADINDYRMLASTAEGFAQLVSEGKALATDTRESFLQRLEQLQQTATNTQSLYQSLNLRYGGLVDKNGKQVYSSEVIDKMVYAASKVADYDVRIPKLSAKLISTDIDVDSVVKDIISGNSDSFNEAIEKIQNLGNLNDDQKLDIAEAFEDVVEMGVRRDNFLKEYNKIKESPELFKEVKTEPSPVAPEAQSGKTIKVKTIDGEEDLEIGTEYYAGKKIEVEEGGSINKFSKFTILGEEGEYLKLFVPEENRQILVKKSAFDKYKFGKVSSAEKIPNAKFFIETSDHIFTYNLGKGKKIEGKLSYDSTTDKLIFESLDGKFKKQVTRDQFEPKPGYDVAQIYSNKTFTEKAKQALSEKVSAQEKLDTKNKIVAELYETSKKRVDEIVSTLEANKKKLTSIEESLDNLSKTKAGLPKKRFSKAVMKTINELSKMKADIEKQNAELELEKEELEATLPYLQDLVDNIGELEEGGKELLNSLKSDINSLEELISHTNDAISQGNSLIGAIDSALQTALQLYNDFVKRLSEENPNVPFSLADYQERIEKYLGEEGAKQLIADRLGFTELVLEIEQSLIDFSEELNIPGMERKIEKLQEQIKELNAGLDELINEQMAKAKVLEAFQTYADNFKKQKEQEALIRKNKAMAQEFLGVNSKDVQNTDPESSYEPNAKKPWWSVVAGTVPINDGKAHQARANKFGFNLESFENRDSIHGVVVTANTEDSIIPGLMNHLTADGKNADPKDVIALVMVQLNDDGTYTLVDENGKPIPSGADLINTAIYQVFPSDKLTATYDGKTETMFRKTVSDEARKTLEEQYRNWRKETLSKKELSAPEKISASFGIPDYVYKDDKGVERDYEARTSAEDAGLITKEDLVETPVIKVATTNDNISSKDGSVTFNSPLGRVFMYVRNNGLVKLLNRKFNQREANLIYDVLHQIAKNAVEDNTIKKDRSQVLINWLKSNIYWGIAKNTQTGDKKEPGRNNIWFQDVTENGETFTKLFISGKGLNINFTPSELEANKSLIITLLKEMYNNVNATMVNEKAFNEPYFEITGLNSDGTPVFKEWPNYQSYLLSSEGRPTEDIPMGTAFKPLPKDGSAVNRKAIYFTLDSAQDNFEISKPVPVVTSKPAEQSKPAATTSTPTPNATFDINGGENTLVLKGDRGTVTFTIDKSTYDPKDQTVGMSFKMDEDTTKKLLDEFKTKEKVNQIVGNAILDKVIPLLEANAVPVETATDEVSNEDVEAFEEDMIPPPDDELYKLQVLNEIKGNVSEDWTSLEKWLKANFPNIPVYRVKNVIQATNGKQAWGMFSKGAIYVYENAQVGTAYHEVFHAIMSMFTDPSERNLIYKEFKQRKGQFEDANGNTVNYSDATYKQAEEALADEFSQFVLTGKMPKAADTRPSIVKFFSELLKFIREFFVGPKAQSNTEKLFNKIGSGYYSTIVPYESNLAYAKVGVIDIEDAKTDANSQFSIAKIPVTQVHEIMEDMTYNTLAMLSKDNKSLFSVQSIPKEALYKTLREKLKASLQAKLYYIVQNKKDGLITEAEASAAKKNLVMLEKNIELEWENIIKKHQEFLKTYSIEFDENDEAILNDESNSGKGDYQNATQIDNFKKANSAVKLLIGTLPLVEVDSAGKVKPKRSSIGGMMLAPSDKTFITLMTTLHSSTNIDEMISKLRDLAVNDPVYQLLYTRITKRGADVPGINYDLLKNDYDLQLITAFWRTFKRQNPNVRIVFTLPSGEVVVGDSALSSAAKQSRSEMTSSVISKLRQSNPYVKYDSSKKEYVSQDAIKNVKLQPNVLSTYVEFLKNLGIEFNVKDLKKLNGNQRIAFTEAVEGLKMSLSDLSGVKSLNSTVLDIDNRLLQLGNIKALLERPEFESTYFNLNGERTQTFIGTNLMSDMYDVISKATKFEQLAEGKYKYLLTDAFAQGSAVMNKMFNINPATQTGNRKPATIEMMKTSYVDGSVNEQTNKKKESSKLTYKERILQEINLNLDGYYMNLVPGDASIEWMVNLGTFISQNVLQTTGFTNVHKIFKEYFMAELNLAREARPIVQDSGKTRDTYDLRFFKSMLKPSVHSDIVNMIKAGKSNEEIFKKHQKSIEAAVENTVNEEVKNTKELLLKYDILKYTEEGIDASGIAFDENKKLDEEVLKRELQGLAINYMIANIELHKLVYSDPYQYKDELKRIKNFNSPRQPIVSESKELNTVLNNVYNKGFNRENKAGYTDFVRDFFRTITLSDVFSFNNLPGYEKAFEETDGGGYITMKANRNFRIRAGQWNEAEEKQFRYDVAYEELVKSGASEEEIAKFRKKNPGVQSAYTPIKPIVSGNKVDGKDYNDVVLHKFALVPISFRIMDEINDGANMIDLYNRMIDQDIDYAVFSTGRKVGADETNDFYDPKTGKSAKGEFKGINNIPYSIIGIQAEVPSKDEPKVTQGSQITKLVTMDFMEAGVPIDFEKDLPFEERFVKWTALEDKMSYNGGDNLYKQIYYNQRLLEEKISHGYKILLKKLGLKQVDKGFEIENVDRLINTLTDEILKREVNENITDAFEGFKKGYVILEATPAYQQIRNILYSIADKNVVSPKLNGGMKVQIPSTGFESVRPIKDDSKGGYQSDVLKFYEDKDGERVCEIMIGRWFDTKMNDQELMDYLNSPEGQEILKGVGFRIPTQKQNSIDVFKVVKLLPKEFGDSVVIPSALVKKAGSDFDIDKLSMYLKNVYEDIDGKIKLVPFNGFGEDARESFGKLFDKITEDKKEFAETAITKFSGLQQLLGNILLGTASDKQMAKWIPIFKSMFGKDMSAIDVEQALMSKLEQAGKDLEKLTNADLLAAAREEFIDKMYGKSLENAYLKSLENLISSPENFKALIAPNSADQMKKLAKEINGLLGKPEINYSSTGNMLSRSFMSGLRQAFVSGKYAIGIAATAQTNHSQNQRAPIYIDVDKLLRKDVHPEDLHWLGDGIVNLPHNSIEINGRKVATLSMINNKNNQPISDIIGQFIDGYVDISKGPWIMEMGAAPNVAGTWLFLVKLGVPINTVAYFMNQPIVREYLADVENAGYSWLFIDNFVENTLSNYSGPAVDVKMPNEKALREMVGRDVSDLTDVQKAQQRLILNEFLKYAKMSSHLLEVIQGSNFDTANMNDPFLVFKKMELLKKARKSIISSVDTLLENSFVNKLKDALENIRNAYSKILVSDRDNVRTVIESVLRPYISLSDRDFIKLSRKVVNDLFDWAVQTDRKFNTGVVSILLGSEDKKSAAAEIMEFKKSVIDNPNHPLHNNLIIRSLQQKPGSKDNTPNNLLLTSKDSKVYNQNQIIYAFREFKKHAPNGMYKKLVALSLLQSGLNNSPISFSSLLPYEDFKELYNETLAKINEMPNLAEFVELNVFQRNNWSDVNIVPSKKAEWKKNRTTGDWMSSPSNPMEMKFVKDSLKNAVKKGTIPQVLSISPLSREGRHEFITFVWEDKNFTKEQKQKMRKKGDFSYIKKGLFKRVVDADGKPIITSRTSKKGIVYESYVYKAINAWGDSFRANEFYEENRPSVIDNGYIKVKEVEDSVIENILNTQAGPMVRFADIEDFNSSRKDEILKNYATKHNIDLIDAENSINEALNEDKEATIKKLKECY